MELSWSRDPAAELAPTQVAPTNCADAGMADGPPRAARMARRHSINIADDFERGRPIVDDDLPLAPPQFKRTPKKSFGGGSSALAGLPGAMGALNKSFNTSSPEAAKDGPQALRSPRSSGVRVTSPTRARRRR